MEPKMAESLRLTNCHRNRSVEKKPERDKWKGVASWGQSMGDHRNEAITLSYLCLVREKGSQMSAMELPSRYRLGQMTLLA